MFIVLEAVFILVLFGSYLKSVLQLKKALKRTEDSQPDRWMQIINLSLFILLFLTQLFNAITVNDFYGFIEINILRTAIELFIKCTFLVLINKFGTNLVVKSYNMSNGDLFIVGTDS